MGRDGSETFRDYLQSLPEELLESVTEDYVWLSGLALDEGEFTRRRDCCRTEWERRGRPQLYASAESIVA